MLAKKRGRSTKGKNSDDKNMITTNISFTQVQSDFSSINKMNIPQNNYLLRSEPVKIKNHRTPSKKKKPITASSIKTRSVRNTSTKKTNKKTKSNNIKKIVVKEDTEDDDISIDEDKKKVLTKVIRQLI